MKEEKFPMADRLRLEAALLRVDWELDGRIPGRVRRQIKDELRANLSEAARVVGMKAAIRQLGDLRALGASYLEVYRGRMDLRAGFTAAFVAYVAVQVIAFAVFFAFQGGVLSSGGHSAAYDFLNGFGPFGGSVGAGGRSFEVTILTPAHLVVMLAAFVIGSRIWRLLRRD
jgi:hypothetical protein